MRNRSHYRPAVGASLQPCSEPELEISQVCIHSARAEPGTLAERSTQYSHCGIAQRTLPAPSC